ncbi:hypothetical protein DUNSADRAFT_10068 [Dunaliella salina]|uniref:Guanylate cyclase domain-containing protein n=1 Tax=Dunaliella salina TaxID=3046 RepID=A0ABQ7GG88_DUNSA|nr:hypothetical protein DUNSADRAFT_10068 [Dunaliella salina]|eukprot:KAF5833577.1 hypothetical protein DUNSADRAFT_10068 [Dunaliella salina]
MGMTDSLFHLLSCLQIDTVGDAYLVASGILTPDDEGFNAVDESHNPERGAHRVLAFAQDMLRVSRLVEHLQHVSRMSFSGPMRRPSSMTRAMVEKMMAHSQQQPGNRGPTSLQQQTALSSSKHHEAPPGPSSLCSPRTPSMLGWNSGNMNGLREMNSLWEVAAQQGSSVSQTANAMGGGSGRLCNTVTAPTLADGSSLLNAPSMRSATDEAPTLSRKDSRGMLEDPDRGSDFSLVGSSPAPRNPPHPHQPQFSSRHAERQHTLRSVRHSSPNNSKRISMSAGANVVAPPPLASAPIPQPLSNNHSLSNGGCMPPDTHPHLASLAGSHQSSGRPSVNVEPSNTSNAPAHSNVASYATSALLSSHSRTSHLLRVNRHASSGALSSSHAGGGPPTAPTLAPHAPVPPLSANSSINRQSVNPGSSFEGLVRSQSVLSSMSPSLVQPTNSSPLPKHSHQQQSLPLQQHEQQQQQVVPPPPQLQSQLPKQQPQHLHQKPQPSQQLHHSTSRTSMSVAAPNPTPATATSGTFASGHHAQSSLLLPKAGGRVRAALNALEGSNSSHASNAGAGAPRRPLAQGPRRSISTSYLGGAMWATVVGPSSDPPALMRQRPSQSPSNTPEQNSAMLSQNPTPVPPTRLPCTLTSPSMPSAAALGIPDRPHTFPLQQRHSSAKTSTTSTDAARPPNSEDLGRLLQWQQDKLLESLVKDSKAQEDDEGQDVTEVTEATTAEEPSGEAPHAQQQSRRNFSLEAHHYSLDEPPPPKQPKPYSLRQQAANAAAAPPTSAASTAPGGSSSSWVLGSIPADKHQQRQHQQFQQQHQQFPQQDQQQHQHQQQQNVSQRIVKFSMEPELLQAEDEGRGSSVTSSSSNHDRESGREAKAAGACKTGARRDAAGEDGLQGRTDEEVGREHVDHVEAEYEDEGIIAEEEGRQINWCWHEVVAKRCVDPVTGR